MAYNALVMLTKLTEREKKVLYLLAKGYSNHKVALTLYFGIDTIKSDIKSILKKFSAKNSAEAVGIAYKNGMFDQESFIQDFESEG